MNVGSLFSGIGGLDLGLHRAGWRHVFFCESDAYRRDVLRARFPGIPVHGDVQGFTERTPVALLCGGFPCQDLSVAGRRAGLNGARSGLFHEFARIAQSLRPRALLVENVPGLLSSNGGRDFGVVLGTLADLGYGLGWRILDSRFFGVPQRRRRVFVVGILADGDPARAAERAGEILAVGSSCHRHSAKGDEAGQGAAHVLEDGSGATVSRPLGSLCDGGYRTTDLDGVPAFVNTVTQKWAKGTGGPAGNGHGMAGVDDVNLVPGATRGVRRLTPVECERLQGFPDGWSDLGKTTDSKRYAALGDAVTAPVAEWIGRRLHDHLNAAQTAGEAMTPLKEKDKSVPSPSPSHSHSSP